MKRISSASKVFRSAFSVYFSCHPFPPSLPRAYEGTGAKKRGGRSRQGVLSEMNHRKKRRNRSIHSLKIILRENDLEKGYDLLTKREKDIIDLYYLEGYKDEEIAVFYGLTQQAVNYIRKKGIKKLKIF
jgi:RNA polymerase sigma factor for flagellar operon FliA